MPSAPVAPIATTGGPPVLRRQFGQPLAPSASCPGEISDGNQPSPSRAARRIAAVDAFPTQTGGIGTAGASSTGLPSTSARSPASSRGNNSSAVSVRDPRSPYGTPAAAHCPGPPPEPTPSTSRPPDTYWSVATCLAAQASGRIAG